jgi:hypothetical protein
MRRLISAVSVTSVGFEPYEEATPPAANSNLNSIRSRQNCGIENSINLMDETRQDKNAIYCIYNRLLIWEAGTLPLNYSRALTIQVQPHYTTRRELRYLHQHTSPRSQLRLQGGSLQYCLLVATETFPHP